MKPFYNIPENKPKNAYRTFKVQKKCSHCKQTFHPNYSGRMYCDDCLKKHFRR